MLINSTAIAVLLISFVIMLIMGVEICYSLGVSALITCMYMGIDGQALFQSLITKIGNTSLMAIPFFILMGEFMSVGGISSRLVKLADAFVGWMRGGLAMVNCVDSMLFGGISGSPVADCASLGPIMIPMMEEQGYDKEFATALTMTSSIQGLIIPPSHTMVLYAVTAGSVSIAALYMGGLLAGILLGVILMIYCYIMAVKRNYPYGARFSLKRSALAVKDAIWGIIAMLIVVGGVFMGIMTATEAAAAACVYSAFVAFFVYKEAKLSDLKGIFLRTVKSVATVLFLAAAATAFSWIITFLQIPKQVTNLLLSITTNKYLLLLIINLILLVLGCFMNTSSIILIMVPILLPVVKMLGMNAIQFGVMMVLNLGIGLLTPPVGSVLFVGSSISGIKIENLIKAVMPQFLALLAALLLITFVPAITMALPTFFGYV